MSRACSIPILASTALLVTACNIVGPEPTLDFCEDGKCDTPGSAAQRKCSKAPAPQRALCLGQEAARHCNDRRADSLSSSTPSFTETSIRWACQDVDGVDRNPTDERGQEYCEYYAVVLPPPAKKGAAPVPVKLGQGGQGPLALSLNPDQMDKLEEEADDNPVVAECIFTSWHVDVESPLPVCPGGNAPCRTLAFRDKAKLPSWAKGNRSLGIPMDAKNMRMKVPFNSNGAALDLVERCIAAPPAQSSVTSGVDFKLEPGQGISASVAAFNRGCWKAFEMFNTEWRRSDPTICAAAARLFECGCGIAGKTVSQIAQAIVKSKTPGVPEVPFSRGFRLGTWNDPENLFDDRCRYVDTGDNSHTIVACQLTATDLLKGSAKTDVKQLCRDNFAFNVVVHIPLPVSVKPDGSLDTPIVCKPPAGKPHTNTCGKIPWKIGRENELSVSRLAGDGAPQAPNPPGGAKPGGTLGPADQAPKDEENACTKRAKQMSKCQQIRRCQFRQKKNKACGDACIPFANNCKKGVGCACNDI
jgi:hypothetical protein